MNRKLFSRLKDKFDALKPREKWLIKIALVFIILFIIDRTLISPVRKYGTELAVRIEEKSQLLTDIRKYFTHKELQKELFQGKATDFLNIILSAAKDGRLGPVRLKKTEISDKGILVRFEVNGNIQQILDFILKMDKMNILLSFKKADIELMKGTEYRLVCEIMAIKV